MAIIVSSHRKMHGFKPPLRLHDSGIKSRKVLRTGVKRFVDVNYVEAEAAMRLLSASNYSGRPSGPIKIAGELRPNISAPVPFSQSSFPDR
jgi:hypothetical protein